MKLLLHICCAPCTIYPLEQLRNQAIQVTGYFFNPNIHPYREYRKRRATLEAYSRGVGLQVLYNDRYDLEFFLNNTLPLGPDRCRFCYTVRLQEAAQEAKKQGQEAFSTTLLYSRYQKHDWIREVGEEISTKEVIPFFYEDFRAGWREGIEASKSLGLYRQPYCGCIFSERDRFAPLKGSQRQQAVIF